MKGRNLAALTGFLFLSLSPSYLEWVEHPEKRPQIVGYYAVALGLIYFGALKTN